MGIYKVFIAIPNFIIRASRKNISDKGTGKVGGTMAVFWIKNNYSIIINQDARAQIASFVGYKTNRVGARASI